MSMTCLLANMRCWSAAFLAGVGVLAGCRAEEQRARDYTPGVYKGPQEQEISDETREQLRERTRLQSFN